MNMSLIKKEEMIDDSMDINCCFPSLKKNMYGSGLYDGISVYTPSVTRTPSPEIADNNIDNYNVDADIIMSENLKKSNNEYVLTNGYIVSINGLLVYIIPTDKFFYNCPIFIYYSFNTSNKNLQPQYCYFDASNNLIDVSSFYGA